MYLASKSPQRRALLTALGLDFEVIEPDYREEDIPGLAPAEMAERHSLGKALSVVSALPPSSIRPVLGVDTIVVCDDEVYGKPAGRDQAASYLEKLSGGTHQVISGLTLLWPAEAEGIRTAHAVTEVTFTALATAEMEAYLDTGEWRLRAGAYAIQGRASAFVESIRGDYTNVVGLPVPLLVALLREKGAWPPEEWEKVSG